MLKIRLSRGGAKGHPFFKLIVAEASSPRDGKFIEKLGYFDPFAKDTSKVFVFDQSRYDYWISVGAQSTEKVVRLVAKANGVVLACPNNPIKSALKKKAQKRLAEKQKKAEAAAGQAA